MSEKEVIEGLNLDYINTNPWALTMISALKGNNIPEVVDWLVKKSKEIKQKSKNKTNNKENKEKPEKK